MKILKLGCIVAAILAAAIYAQSPNKETGKIKGNVTDEKGGKIPGVTVRIEGTSMGAATNLNGDYVILQVPVGTYDLTATCIGFTKLTMKDVEVRVDSTTEINFQLTSQTVNSDNIVVYAPIPEINKYIASADLALHARKGGSSELESMPSGIPAENYLGGYNPQHGVHFSPPLVDHNTEGYDRIYENEFMEALTNPLSTFSIDVDAASYTNTRRFLNEGRLPPPDAVRIEEFINYFDYDYPQPENDVPFSITTEVSSCPWKADHKLLHIGLQGKNVPMENIPPGNLVFLIDVSGSMDMPNKLPLLKSAFKLLIKQLRDEDRVAIVVYAGASGLVLPSTPGSEKEIIQNAIANLYPGGSTAGAAGIKLAYEIAAKNYVKNGNNRVILATDGDFNVGISSDGELVRLIEEKREEGVFLTVLGFGTGNLKDSKMEKLADKGNGNYSYIDNIMEARKVLVNELGGTLFTIAKDVKIQIEFNPAKVLAYRLIGYENRMLKKEDFNDDKKDAGEIGSGHTVTTIYEIIPAGTDVKISDVDELKYQRTGLTQAARGSDEFLTVKFRYKKPDGDKSKLITVPVSDQEIELAASSDNFRFSAAVAEFGMLLRDSKFKGDSNYDQVVTLASGAKGEDSEGYREEFISLVKLARDLSDTVAEK